MLRNTQVLLRIMNDQLTLEELPKSILELHHQVNSIKELVLLLTNTTKTIEQDEILTIEEAATLVRLSVPTLYGLVHRKSIPVSKKGKRLYFSRLDLLSWIAEGRKKTNEEISAEAANFLNNQRRGGNK